MVHVSRIRVKLLPSNGTALDTGQSQIIHLYTVNRLVFLKYKECVLCQVGALYVVCII
jgi:hypothetical protein